MDPQDADSVAVPLESGVVFLSDDDLETSERQYLKRQEQEKQERKEADRDTHRGTALDPAVQLDVPSELPGVGTGSDRNSTHEQSDPGLYGLDEPAEEGAPAEEEEGSLLRSLLEWVTVLVGAVVVAMLMRAFLFQAFQIPSESMEATLAVGDRVMVNRLSYRLHDVNRGDVIVFTTPAGIPASEAHLIKRVVGLAGETIEGRDNAVYVNGRRVAEPYLDPADTIYDFEPFIIPANTVFVMGDNRDDSGDSRIFGPIETETIVGRAFIIYWPFDRLDGI